MKAKENIKSIDEKDVVIVQNSNKIDYMMVKANNKVCGFKQFTNDQLKYVIEQLKENGNKQIYFHSLEDMEKLFILATIDGKSHLMFIQSFMGGFRVANMPNKTSLKEEVLETQIKNLIDLVNSKENQNNLLGK